VVATHDSRLADRADRVVNLVDGLIVDESLGRSGSGYSQG
jgi:predicted ABC-type transport system involved in lysophospholipase L1 biosynthesis ATPase subunit